MKKRPDWLKKIESGAKVAGAMTSAKLKKAARLTKEAIEELDRKYKISGHVSQAKNATLEKAKELDERHQLRKKGKEFADKVGQRIDELSDYAERKGITGKARGARDSITENVIDPVSRFAEEKGVNKRLSAVGKSTSENYGRARAWLKPYFAPETPEELLRSTKRELIYVNACILQISRDEAEHLANKLGTAIVSKVAGAASVGTLLGMVSTFGTASTGTAIASLHGAAATNATLAWVGGLLGGGMAAGAVVTGGVALAVGFGVYRLLSSDARQFEDLTAAERQIVEATGFLIAAIDDVLKHDSLKLDVDEAELLLENTLIPLHESLIDHADEISANLDTKNSFLFKQHAIVDFENSVLEGFKYFIADERANRRRFPQYVIAGVIYALLTHTTVDDSRESQLALQAIRRSKVEWNDASEAELSSELEDMGPEQLKGLANNVKGIYHELLFVDDYNSSHQDTYAELYEATNHPGADVRILSRESGELIEELQLKATDNADLIQEHFERYPDIKVVATEEIAATTGLAGSSGISNPEITDQTDSTLDGLADNTIMDRATESGELAVLIKGGREALRALSGEKTANQAAKDTVKAATVVATSTAIVAYLFS